MRSFHLFSVLCCLLLFASSSHARTWSDKSGKHKIEAEFVEATGGNAKLKKPDGKVITIPLAKLSKDDQRHIRDIVKGQASGSSGGGTNSSDKGRGNGSTFNYSERTRDGNTIIERSFSHSTGNAAKADKPKRRTWTDATGKHNIEATFMELVDDKVRLRREDGKVLLLPLNKLSEKDQEAAKRLASGIAPNSSDPNDPFGDASIDSTYGSGAPKREEGVYLPGDIVEATSFGEIKRGTVTGVDDRLLTILFDGESDTDRVFIRSGKIRMIKANPNAVARGASGNALSGADYSGVEQVMLGTHSPGAFTPDPLVATKTRLRALRVGPKRGFFEDLESFAISPNGRFALLAHSGGADPSSEESRLELCDLTTGKVRQIDDVPKGLKSAAISPSGLRIAATSGKAHHDSETLDIYNVGPNGLQHSLSWKPFKDAFFKDVKGLTWLGDSRLATVGMKNITIWDVETAQAIYTLELNGLSCGVVSPGMKQLALADSKAINVLDAATGEPLQQVALPQGRRHQAIAFDPSGKLLAGTDGSQVDLINLETGELFDTLYLPSSGSTISWADSEHLLVGGSSLVHVPSQMVIWNYKHNANKTTSAAGINWYLLDSGGARVLLPLRLPHAGVKSISDSEVVLRSGDAIALEFELMSNLARGGKSILDEAKKSLTTHLEAAGYVIAENAPAVLVVRAETGEQREMQYQEFGFRRGAPDKVSVPERIYTLELQIDGKTVWTRKRTQGPPHMLHMNKGESTQQAVARAMEPSAGYFGTGIPSRILPAEKMEQRQSEITSSGIR
ncbi:SHD1 domain-containing protein [Adhaeretor mobilis]|nr:SHD1 domain-containing protein [Adhaeretor mobilis]